MRVLKVFIAGPRAINELDENICIKLNSICEKNYDVLVGDADGIDSSIQKFLNKKDYKNVTVFASKGIARNNYGNWKIENVVVDDNVTGFDFYATKDLNLEKEVILYYVLTKKFYQFKEMRHLEDFLNTNVKLDSKLKKLLPKKEGKQFAQACMF